MCKYRNVLNTCMPNYKLLRFKLKEIYTSSYSQFSSVHFTRTFTCQGSGICLNFLVCLKSLSLHLKVKTGLKVDHEKNRLKVKTGFCLKFKNRLIAVLTYKTDVV